MTGTIFDIQRFSVHDGPGIRTTVFLKGCPLRCKWCHNPEGLTKDPQFQYFCEECISCGRCAPRESLSDADRCPTGALKVCGREIGEEELLEELLKDQSYYRKGGGVTFSGGECLIQADFVAAMLNRLKQHGIHTAIDTSGFVPWENIQKTLDNADLYLYDIKCADSALHREFTGVPNERILENLRRLDETGKAIWIRTPVIPGFNDSEEEMAAIVSIVRQHRSIQKVTLMPYHTLGKSKYATLGMEPPYHTEKMLDKTVLEQYRNLFRNQNILVD